MSAPLVLTRLSMRFGGITALDRIDLAVAPGEMVGLMGPNGSGKTTLLNVVCGYYRQSGGRVYLGDRRLDGRSAAQRARLGLGRSFQVTKVFRRLTVMENLLVPALTAWSLAPAAARAKAATVLAALNLERLKDARAADLSGGQAKLLEFGRMMMLDPKIILLDEPFGGVYPELKAFMQDHLRRWNAAGVTIVLISHDMGALFGLCPRVVTLAGGRVIADGPAEAVRRDPAVLDAYLGDHYAA